MITLDEILNLFTTASPHPSPKKNQPSNAAHPAKKPLLGRVLAKSGIKNFGKPNDKSNFSTWVPCQFYIIIGDHSRELQVTFWGRAVWEHFNKIQVGDIVRIVGHTLRKRPSYLQKGLDVYEATINSSPKIEISVTSLDALLGRFNNQRDYIAARFPMRPMVLPTYSELSELPEDQLMDLIGRVSFMSPMYYEIMDFKCQGCYRWLQIDNCNKESCIMVKAYAMTQKNLLESLEPGSLVHLSQLRVKTVEMNSESQNYFRYCVSTFTTAYSVYASTADLPRWIKADPAYKKLAKSLPSPISFGLLDGYFDLPISEKVNPTYSASSFRYVIHI